ncbi:Sodium/hydrogen exchanger [Atractiella rhizophila]|nr:Sodium/hydrogen exchanger [Atractiella rhizophila]
MASFLPYHEPSIRTILINGSFLLTLNWINYILDSTVYCGLIGQIFIGVAWGTPAGKWLTEEAEHTIVQLGYLGLILLVYEGGLSTSFSALKANLLLSTSVALTGILMPIALSFLLVPIAKATHLQAFAAGAALCSTSLGTTFTVLSTSGLTNSRLGVVLTSAAMMDDVVGLVMVQVISNLGNSSSSGRDALEATDVIRPIAVSIGFAVLIPLACRWIVKPLTEFLNRKRMERRDGFANRILRLEHTPLILHLLILLAFVAAGSYAGTSNLFTAYIAGACIGWWDTEVGHCTTSPPSSQSTIENEPGAQAIKTSNKSDQLEDRSKRTGQAIYSIYLSHAVDRILKPFFFASIGFSIPISRMFDGPVIWRGIVYSILMAFAKIVCGLWLVRMSMPPAIPRILRRLNGALPKISHDWWPWKKNSNTAKSRSKPLKPPASPSLAITRKKRKSDDSPKQPTQAESSPEVEVSPRPNDHTSPDPPKPLSLYPAGILGCAMVARGEIGFLISSLADSRAIFSNSEGGDGESDQIFLIIIWAIMVCTIVGPLSVGLLVKRVKRLDSGHQNGGGANGPLGVWGVK